MWAWMHLWHLFEVFEDSENLFKYIVSKCWRECIHDINFRIWKYICVIAATVSSWCGSMHPRHTKLRKYIFAFSNIKLVSNIGVDVRVHDIYFRIWKYMYFIVTALSLLWMRPWYLSSTRKYWRGCVHDIYFKIWKYVYFIVTALSLLWMRPWYLSSTRKYWRGCVHDIHLKIWKYISILVTVLSWSRSRKYIYFIQYGYVNQVI